jgi:hypothetical protein
MCGISRSTHPAKNFVYEKRATTPRWVIKFTSKLQGR